MTPEDLLRKYLPAIKKAKDGVIEFSDRYLEAVKDAEEIAVHADGEFPEHLITKAAPSETPEEFEYRKENYQSVTMGAWDKIVSSTNGIWHGVSITCEPIQEYLDQEYPADDSFLSWVKEDLTPRKASEPNAVAYVTPNELPLTRDGEEIVVDTSAQLRPVACILRTDQIAEYQREKFLFAVLDEKSKLASDKNENTGWVFLFLDAETEYRIYQTGQKKDYTFEIVEYYTHDLGRLPAYVLGGKPKKKEVHKSVFANAIPHLNKAAFESSSQDASITRTCFPTRVYYADECEECNGQGYYIDDEIGPDHRESCTTCKGSGKVNGFTPFRDFIHKPPGAFQGEEQTPFPGYDYVSPDTAPMEFLEKRIDSHIEKAGYSVNIDLTKGPVKTATEKHIDLKERQAMLVLYASSVYDLGEWLCRDIAEIRTLSEQVVEINRRPEFDVRTPEELNGELKDSIESGLPIFSRVSVIEQQTKARQGPRQKRLLEIAQYCDPLLGYTTQEAQARIGKTVQEWQGVLHDQFNMLVTQSEIEVADFLSKDLPEIYTVLMDKAKAMVPSRPGSPEDIFNGLAG